MTRIVPPIEPTNGLYGAFGGVLGKYFDRSVAEDDIQSDIREQLRSEIESNFLITPKDCPIEVDFDIDNLMEWLSLYYRIEPK